MFLQKNKLFCIDIVRRIHVHVILQRLKMLMTLLELTQEHQHKLKLPYNSSLYFTYHDMCVHFYCPGFFAFHRKQLISTLE